MSRITLAAALAAATLAALPTPAAQADGPLEVGVLTCHVVGGVGFIFGSTRDLDCFFAPARRGPPEHYFGQINRFGVDIGAVKSTTLVWGVLAPTAQLGRHALAGGYVGVSGEATVGIGLGANALVGGINRSITLNPLSIQAQTGVNVAAGVAGLSLEPR